MQTDSERPYLPPIAAAAEQQRPGGKKRTLDVRKGLYLRSSHDVAFKRCLNFFKFQFLQTD